jgi:Arc/MetJ family transcription regulator
MHMKTTLDLKDDLLQKAREMTVIQEKTALVHAGLKALIERAAAERLAALGGSMPDLEPVRRRTQEI